MYDCVTYQKNPLATFRGHSNATFYVKSCVSPDDQYLFSGSGDSDGYIWRIDDPAAAPFHLTGHTNEVTSVAWCPRDQTKVCKLAIPKLMSGLGTSVKKCPN
jgi:denticleless